MENGTSYDAVAGDIDQLRTALDDIAKQVSSASGAETADSAASRAVLALDGTLTGVKAAYEKLTIGLSAAK